MQRPARQRNRAITMICLALIGAVIMTILNQNRIVWDRTSSDEDSNTHESHHHQPLNTKDDHMWGTYRGNIYFGMRMARPITFMSGLMWFGMKEYADINSIYHYISIAFYCIRNSI